MKMDQTRPSLESALEGIFRKKYEKHRTPPDEAKKRHITPAMSATVRLKRTGWDKRSSRECERTCAAR